VKKVFDDRFDHTASVDLSQGQLEWREECRGGSLHLRLDGRGVVGEQLKELRQIFLLLLLCHTCVPLAQWIGEGEEAGAGGGIEQDEMGDKGGGGRGGRLRVGDDERHLFSFPSHQSHPPFGYLSLWWCWLVRQQFTHHLRRTLGVQPRLDKGGVGGAVGQQRGEVG
jgi:hypothetical protein